MVTNRMLDAALRYAARGWPVIPLHTPTDYDRCSCNNTDCASVGKHPRTQHGLSDASTDPETIGKWWGQWPKANIGVITNDLVVIDIDPRHGGDESYRDLIAKHGPGLTQTLTAVTGGGGQHLVFACPAGVHIGNVANRPGYAGPLGPGVDVRAYGGYIVAPPSLHQSGTRYQWEEEGEQPARLPLALYELLTARPERQVEHETVSAADILNGVDAGGRDWALFRLAAKLRYADVPYDWARTLVLEAAANARPPFPANEALKKLDSAYKRYEAGKGAFVDTTREKAREEEAAAGLFVWPHELDNLPEMSWRVEGIMPNDSTGMLYGKFGSRKTFATLDMACCIATGKAWHGHAVEKGYVIYIYAEGLRGLKARLRAWEEAHKRKVENIAFVPRAIRFMDKKDVDFLIERISAEVPEMPVTVFIDTLARAMVGGDENDQKDMGLMVENADILRRATGATVWWNHHTNKVDDYRGSSALPGALDVMVKAEREGEILKLICEKMKDAEEFEDIELVATPVLQSIILTSKDSAGVRKARYDALSNDDKEAYRKLAEDLRGEATWGVWLTLTAMSKDSFKRCLERLQKAGMVKHDGIKKVYRSLYKVAEDTDEEVLL